jgi:hypothetical protein
MMAPLGSLRSISLFVNRTVASLKFPALSPPDTFLLLLTPLFALLILSTLPRDWLATRLRPSHLLLKLSAILQHEWLFQLLLALFLIAMRLPLLALPELNPDESTFAAAANKLLRDPVFYRSVDTGTSGPVSIYPLLLPALFGFQIDYASGRFVDLLLLAGAAIFIYRGLRILAPRPLARFAVLPLAGWFASVTFGDFVHGSSEHVPVFLISVALWLSISILHSDGRSRMAAAALGLVCGLLILSKFQSIPIGAAIVAATCIGKWLKEPADLRRRILVPGMLCGSMAGVVILAYLFFSLFGVAADFRASYVIRNVNYPPGLSLYEKVRRIWQSLFIIKETYYFYLGVLIFLLLETHRFLKKSAQDQGPARDLVTPFALFGSVAVALTLGSELISDTAVAYSLLFFLGLLVWGVLTTYPSFFDLGARLFHGKLALLVVLFLLASIYAVAAPGTGFYHYQLFLITPFCFCAAILLFQDSRSPANREPDFNPWLCLRCRWFFLLLFLVPFLHNLSEDRQGLFLTSPPALPAAARAISALARPGEYLAVWGWQSELYVDSQTVQATQHSDSIAELENGPYRDLARRRYVQEFEKTRPPIFADAVGPTSFGYHDRAKLGHEQFPELAAIIASDYAFVADLDSTRLYVRKERLPTPALDSANDDVLRYRQSGGRLLSVANIPSTFVVEVVVLPFLDQVPWASILGNSAGGSAREGFALQRYGGEDVFYLGSETEGGGPALSTKFALTPLKVHYVVAAVREKVISVEVDGIPAADQPLTREVTPSSAVPTVVGNWPPGDRPFQGVVFEARISRGTASFDKRAQTLQRARDTYGIE